MMVIWKYELQIKDAYIQEVPEGAKPLSMVVQRGKPVIYFLVPCQAAKARDRWYISVISTGNDITSLTGDETFLGTLQLYDGDLMFHVFVSFNGQTS